jgi:hypothetical protein
MPITDQTPIVQYIGNGSTKIFPFPFKIIQNSDLTVSVNTVYIGNGFYIEGAGNENGGSVIFYEAPVTGATIIIERHVPHDRSTDYLNGGALDAQTLDNDFDRIIMMIQDLDAYNYGSTNYSTRIETYTATSGQTVFNTINDIAVAANSVNVYVNGVYQTPALGYIPTSTNQITFTEGLELGDLVTIEFKIAAELDTAAASNISIIDTGSHYTSTNVEGALEEIATTLGAVSGGSLIPAQAGHSGQYLTTNGTSASWGFGANAINVTLSNGSSTTLPISGATSGDQLNLATNLNFTPATTFTINTNYGWKDIIGDIVIKSPGTGTEPSWGVFRDNLYCYLFGASSLNECWINYHVNHDYAVGTPIYLHVHWVSKVATSGTVRWGFEYTIAKGHGQEAFPTSTTVYVEQANAGQYYHHLAEINTGITSSSLEPDSIIMVRIFRDGAHVNDTFPDVAGLIMADVHYQSSKFATKNRAPNFNL